MNRCKTCKWWAEFKWGHLCEHPCQTESDTREDGMWIYNDIDSGIMTGPEFGCVLHEPEETK